MKGDSETPDPISVGGTRIMICKYGLDLTVVRTRGQPRRLGLDPGADPTDTSFAPQPR